MKALSSKVTKPFSAYLGAVFSGVRAKLIRLAANADKGTVRATVAYIGLWLLAALCAMTQISNSTTLFR